MPYPVHAPRRLGKPAIGLARQLAQLGQPAIPGQFQSGSYLPRQLGPQAARLAFFAPQGRPGLPIAVAYSDVATGNLIFAGSGVEGKTGSDSSTGTLIFGGSRVESKTGADTQTGNLVFGGSSTESKTGNDSRTGTLIFTGSSVEAASFSQTATGTLIFTGTGTDSYSPPGSSTAPSWVVVAPFVRI